jgi:hypothetical protein
MFALTYEVCDRDRRLGEDSAHLIGGLIVSTLALAAFSRAEAPPETRRPFFIYLDEFQSFTTLMLANICRSYGSTASA